MDTRDSTDRAQAPHREIWFPAKRYGWGWGVPVAWQGWVALVLDVACLATMAVVFPPGLRPSGFTIGVGIATALLLAVCWWKGERPRWHWGD